MWRQWLKYTSVTSLDVDLRKWKTAIYLRIGRRLETGRRSEFYIYICKVLTDIINTLSVCKLSRQCHIQVTWLPLVFIINTPYIQTKTRDFSFHKRNVDWIRVAQSLVFSVVFCKLLFALLSFILMAIVLSVLRFMASGYLVN